MLLRGIGPGYTQRIVAGRPFQSRDELVTRNILPFAIYTRIADSLVTSSRNSLGSFGREGPDPTSSRPARASRDRRPGTGA
jgi:hypothetical protein